MPLKVLFQDDALVAIEKPSGIHVHPPEDPGFRIHYEENGLALVRDQIGRYLYPVHRLDPATSGVLIYALSSAAARELSQAFTRREVEKEYWAVVRGYAGPSGVIDRALKRDSNDSLAEARTDWLRVAQVELPEAIPPHPTARYSWLIARPHSGVWHQIRRHLAGISHPVIGDVMHGVGVHNRFFREKLGFHRLLLRARSIRVPHPDGGSLFIDAGSDPLWSRVRHEIPWVWDRAAQLELDS